MARRWWRRAGPRIAAALLLAVSGCTNRVVPPRHQVGSLGQPPSQSIPESQALLRYSKADCRMSMVVCDVNNDGKPAPLDPVSSDKRHHPRRALQTSYEDYLRARGMTGSENPYGATSDTEAPPSGPLAKTAESPPDDPPSHDYLLTPGPQRVRVENAGYCSGEGGSGLFFSAPGPAYVALIVVGVLGLVALLSYAFERASVFVEFNAEPGQSYLLQCDEQREPWCGRRASLNGSGARSYGVLGNHPDENPTTYRDAAPGEQNPPSPRA
jgi:hypothetical protein